MKKLFLMAVMVAATLSANAQREPGTLTIQPKVGAGLSNITKFNPLDEMVQNMTIDKKMNIAAMAGAELEYQLTPMFSAAVGLNYSIQGTAWKDIKVTGSGGYAEMKDMQMNLDYVNLPIVVNAYLFKGFAVKAGVQLGYLTSAKFKYTQDINGDEETHESSNGKDDCQKIDFSIPVGVSYEISNVVFDLRYQLGLTKIFKDTFWDKSSKNSVFMLTVGYKIDL